MTVSLILASILGQAPASASAPAPAPAPAPTAASASAQPVKPAAPKVLTPDEKAIEQASLRVTEARAAYQEKGISPKEKARRKKAVLRAEANARAVRDSIADKSVRQQQAAYIDKMMPVWLEQQRQNAQFSIEAAKAQALQQMANTAERQRIDNLYMFYQLNQVRTQSPQLPAYP
jgi:hypothetical protein